MPESESSDDRLAKEAQVLSGGGTASTARTLDFFISYYILAKPAFRSKLESELEGNLNGWPKRVPSWTDLEKVQYLQDLIREGLR